jgi:putative sigma-54 modulation protein
MRKDLNIVIKGSNMKITDALRQYVQDKIGRTTKYFDRIQSAEVELTCQDHKSAEESQRVQVTMNANGTIFRCEESSISMYASIDIVAEKLERQLKRYKKKLITKGRGPKQPYAEPEIPVDSSDMPEHDSEIVKVKRFAVKPMTPHEASLQMEMLNHNFFVFLNPDSEQINVIYKRGDGDYGLIEPDFE